jgi:hypothetical protein
MKIARALQRADEGQADCYWHDNSMSMRYLIVLQGAASNEPADDAAMVLAGQDGRITDFSKEFYHVSQHEPGLLPGDTGPLTVLLIL